MTKQTDHAPSTQRFVDKWITPKGIGHELQIPQQTFCQRRVKHAGRRAHRIGRLVLINRTDFNASLPQRTIVRMSEERRRPSRLTPARCSRGPHDSGRRLSIAELPSMDRNGNV